MSSTISKAENAFSTGFNGQLAELSKPWIKGSKIDE